jgi:hypothetical protein
MIFGKKKSNDSRRVRQPGLSGGLGTKPVFSYHAQSARTEPTGIRKATKLFWASAGAKPSPRQDPRRWPRRVLAVSLLIFVAALAIHSLFLGREPVIVVHEQADGRQVLLRSQKTYQEAARATLGSSFMNSNKLTINTSRVAGDMKKQFPELAHVSVVLPLIGRQPTIHILTVQPALLMTSSATGGVFLVDDSGRAVMEAMDVAASVKQKLPVVQDESGLPIVAGKSALPSDNIAFITEVVGQFAAKNLKITAMVLPVGASELDVRIEGAPYMVKFNLRGDARAEVGTFLAVKQHLEREGKTPGSYIDVRVDNKAYYR